MMSLILVAIILWLIWKFKGALALLLGAIGLTMMFALGYSFGGILGGVAFIIIPFIGLISLGGHALTSVFNGVLSIFHLS